MPKALLWLALAAALWAAAGPAGAQESGYEPGEPLLPLANPEISPPQTTPPPITTLPLEGPNVSPGSGPAQAVPPVAAPPQPAGMTPLDITGDRVRYTNRVVVASGHVRAVYRGLEARSDYLTADLDADTAAFTGNVTLHAQGETLQAESLFLRLDTGVWEIRGAHGAISPAFFQRGVVAPVYVGADEITGGRTPMLISGGQVTTCDLPRPHYQLSARRVLIYPGRRLVAERVSFLLGRRRLFTVPRFSIPLRERQRVPIVPEVGQNEIDGAYLRTRYNYSLGGSTPGSLLMSLTERRGLGTGLEQRYAWAGTAGSLLLYRIGNPGEAPELQGRLSHRQDLGSGFSLEAFADYRKNSGYYLPGTSLLNSQVFLTRSAAGANTRLALTYTQNQGLSDLRSLLGTLQHYQTLGRRTVSLDTTYQMNNIPGGLPDDVEINNRVQLVDHQRPFDLVLDVAKRLDPDRYEGDDFYQVLDRIPQLTVESTSYRLPALSLLRLPARASLSLGEFFERPTDLRASRVAMAYDTLPVSKQYGGLRVSGQAGFRQTFYGDQDHTAQYAYNSYLNLDQRLTSHWSLRAGYSLLKPKGYTPFRFDYLGSYENASAGLVFENGRAGRASLLTGYDFENATWRNLQLRLNERLTRTVSLALSSAYDLNRGDPREIAALGVLADSRTAWALGLRFDPRTSRWRRITSELDWRISDKWRLQAINGWDGATHRFLYNEVLLVRDLHCWEALLYYSQSRRLVRMDLRIKAFEWGRRDFGVARTGQYLSPVPPEVY